MFCFSCHFVYMVNTQIDTGVLAACFRVDRENKRSSYCLVQLYEPMDSYGILVEGYRAIRA